MKNFFDTKSEYIDDLKYKKFFFFGKELPFKLQVRLDKKFLSWKPQLIENLKIQSKVSGSLFDNTAIVAIFKNEPDIIEWIEYHKIIGITRFYLYDNESTDDAKEKLQPYIEDGTVVYHYVEGRCMQMPVYRDAVYRYKNNCKWLAIIDLDEYIVPVVKNDINEVLKDFESYPAVGVNWLVFDSNGHQKRPKGLVLEEYTRVQKDCDKNILNTHIKSIVNPKKVLYIRNPHFCHYKGNELAVNIDCKEIGDIQSFTNADNAFTSYVSIDKIRVNHYHTKSHEDYQNKIKLGFSDKNTERPKDDFRLDFCEFANDYSVQKYIPQLKEKLFEKGLV